MGKKTVYVVVWDFQDNNEFVYIERVHGSLKEAKEWKKERWFDKQDKYSIWKMELRNG